VEFVFNTAVERIEVKDAQACGVVLEGGGRVEADVILANADLPYVYQSLLPEADLAEQLAHKRFSCSAISFFWGVDQPYRSLSPHTLFLADDYRGNFKSISHHLGLSENPSLYVHAPARLDTTLAPHDQDTLIAVVPTSHLSDDGHEAWKDIRDKARQAVFNRLSLLGITDLADHIKFEVNYTPLSWRKRYNVMKGATHGLCHNLTQLGYLRPDNRHLRYHNLYFVGASTRPGTGMPTALISARLVTDRIAAEL
jgi:phytoene desaturase